MTEILNCIVPHLSISILGIHFASIRLSSGGTKMKQGLPLCEDIPVKGKVLMIDAVIKVRRDPHRTSGIREERFRQQF